MSATVPILWRRRDRVRTLARGIRPRRRDECRRAVRRGGRATMVPASIERLRVRRLVAHLEHSRNLPLESSVTGRPDSAVHATGRRDCDSRAAPRSPVCRVRRAKAAHPLGTLPEIEMRHEQAGRSTVLGRERRAIDSERDPRFTAGDVRRWAGSSCTRPRRRRRRTAPRRRRLAFARLEQRVDRHAFPARIELRPFRHAVDVDGRCLARQRLKLVPRPAHRVARCRR